MRKMKVFLLMNCILISCIFLSCILNSTKNNAPKIVSMTASPSIIYVKFDSSRNQYYNIKEFDWVTLAIVATDKDDDELTYMWSSEYGYMDVEEITKATLRWGPFGLSPDNYIVKCIVSDGKDATTGTVTIRVVQKL